MSPPLAPVPEPPGAMLTLKGSQIQTINFRLAEAHLTVSPLVTGGAEGTLTVGAEVTDHVWVMGVHVGLKRLLGNEVSADIAV